MGNTSSFSRLFPQSLTILIQDKSHNQPRPSRPDPIRDLFVYLSFMNEPLRHTETFNPTKWPLVGNHSSIFASWVETRTIVYRGSSCSLFSTREMRRVDAIGSPTRASMKENERTKLARASRESRISRLSSAQGLPAFFVLPVNTPEHVWVRTCTGDWDQSAARLERQSPLLYLYMRKVVVFFCFGTPSCS